MQPASGTARLDEADIFSPRPNGNVPGFETELHPECPGDARKPIGNYSAQGLRIVPRCVPSVSIHWILWKCDQLPASFISPLPIFGICAHIECPKQKADEPADILSPSV